MAAIECPHCGTRIDVSDDAIMRHGHQQSSEHGREWILIEDGVAVHRCDEAPLTLRPPD